MLSYYLFLMTANTFLMLSASAENVLIGVQLGKPIKRSWHCGKKNGVHFGTVLRQGIRVSPHCQPHLQTIDLV